MHGVSSVFEIGGIPPTAIAQVYEFAPRDRKVVLTAVMLSGFGICAILAAGLSILLLGHVGFRLMFGFGALPLVTLVPLAAWLLPGLPATEAEPHSRSTDQD